MNGGGSQQTDLQSLPGLRLGGAGGGAAEFGSLETESNAVISTHVYTYLHHRHLLEPRGMLRLLRQPSTWPVLLVTSHRWFTKLNLAC